jgi:hypothetical protein
LNVTKKPEALKPVDPYGYMADLDRTIERPDTFHDDFTPGEAHRLHLRLIALYHHIGSRLFAFLDEAIASETNVQRAFELEAMNRGRRPQVPTSQSDLPLLVQLLPRLLYPNGPSEKPAAASPLFSPSVLAVLRDASLYPPLLADALERLARAICPPAHAGKGRRVKPLDEVGRRLAPLYLKSSRLRLARARRGLEGIFADRLREALALGHDANTTAAVYAFAWLHEMRCPLAEVDADEALCYFDSARKALRPTKRAGGGDKRLLSPSTNEKRTRRIAPTGAAGANEPDRKRGPHHANPDPHEARPKQAESTGAARLPTRRRPGSRRPQPQPPPADDLPRRDPRRSPRKGDPDPSG